MRNIENPVVLVVGNPVKGFKFFGPWPEADNVDGAKYAREQHLENHGEDYWEAPLRDLLDLTPADDDRLDDIRPPAMTKRVFGFGVAEGDLDELVHEVASRLASEANNGGVAAQVAFLLEHLSPENVLDEAKRIGDENTTAAGPAGR
jgi:hypothetical protein